MQEPIIFQEFHLFEKLKIIHFYIIPNFQLDLDLDQYRA